MAWNGSGGAADAPRKGERRRAAGSGAAPRPIPSAKGKRPLRGILAALVVVIGAGLAWWMLSRPAEVVPEPEAKPKPAKRSEVEFKTTKPKPDKETAPKPIDPDARPTKVGEIVNNYIKLPSGRLHYIKGEVTNNVAATMPKEWYEVFDHQCENEIALYLTMEPGETLVGTPVYRGRFVKEFLKSLETPIIPRAEDSQEVKDLKRAVNEAKIELKAAYDRGEDIEQIMLDTRSQLQDLAAYKRALEGDLKEMVRESATSAADIDDFIEAANRMLAEKGIAPMALNPLARKRLERLIQQKANENE